MTKFMSGSFPKFLTERILNCFGILLATRPIQASKILDMLQLLMLMFPHHSGKTEDRRLSRSVIGPTDWSCCNKMHKKVREMQNVCTTEACQTMKEAAESRCDERMLPLLHGVNNELIAAEAKYHKSCFTSYVGKSNLKHQAF